MNQPALILASASPRREKLLRQLEIDFEVVPAQIQEFDHEYLTPKELCQLNAHRKARSIAKKHPDLLVLGADTVVALRSKVFGKPKDRQEAMDMLQELQGKTHQVLTGVSLIQLRTHYEQLFVVATRVKFRRLKPSQIRDYLSLIDPLDKAGGYAIQEHGDQIIEKIEGSRTNVIGLPLERLKEELEKLSIWETA